MISRVFAPSLVFTALVTGAIAQNIVQTYDSFHYIGCFNDSSHPLPTCSNNNDPPAARTLRHSVGSWPNMTVEICIDQCLAGGFTLAGVEYSDECYCGNAIQYQSDPTFDYQCYRSCAGDASEICGGDDHITIYQNGDTPYTTGPAEPVFSYKDWEWNGCFEDLPDARHIPNKLSIPPYEMTVERCLDAGEAASYNVCGLQYGQECWCGNVTLPPGESVNEPECCIMPCNDNAGEICGGSQLNWVLYLPSALDNREN